MTTNGKLTAMASRWLLTNVLSIFTNCDLMCRPREPKLKEREATSLIPCPVTVASRTGTSKRRDVPQLDTHPERSADVSHSAPSIFSCTYPILTLFLDNWSLKSKRRTGQGTGRMRVLRHQARKLKNGYREGCKAPESNKWKNRAGN